jgi:hypothetical protein
MVSSAFTEMYIQMTCPTGATQKALLDLLLPYVKKMDYQGLLVLTTEDKNIHVCVRFIEPNRKEVISGRIFRNVYSKAFALLPGKKATDYITIGHKLNERDYENIAEVVFNDRWGAVPGVVSKEDMERELLHLKPMFDRYLKLEGKLRNMMIDESQRRALPLPEHNHRVRTDFVSIPYKDMCPSIQSDTRMLTQLVVLEDGCPMCDHLKKHHKVYKTPSYESFHRFIRSS